MSEDTITDNEDTRWVGLSSYISFSLVTSFIASLMAHAAGVLDLSAVPEIAYTAYIGLVLAACYYALGEEAVNKGTEEVMEDK